MTVTGVRNFCKQEGSAQETPKKILAALESIAVGGGKKQPVRTNEKRTSPSDFSDQREGSGAKETQNDQRSNHARPGGEQVLKRILWRRG